MNKVLILEGGFNEEHEVSLNTSREIKRSLKNLNIKYKTILVNPKNFLNHLNEFSNDYLCFNALHGTFGEDGQVQKILEEKKFRFTHSDSSASNFAFNKNLTKQKIKNTKILTPDSFVLNIEEVNRKILSEVLEDYKSFIIKPVASGSSFGIKIFKNIDDINNFYENINKYKISYNRHPELMIEKYINGRELTVSVFQIGKESKPIEVTEIISKNSYFDYQSKYTKGYSKHIIPAKLPKVIYNKCLEYSKKIHDVLNCKGISRSDYLFDEENLYFLEINSQPGLTPISLVPEQLKFKNMDFDFLVKNLIENAL